MMDVTPRPVLVGPSERGDVRVPEDVAKILGEDADLEVGSGQVVTLRPHRLRTAALVQAAGAMPLDDPEHLRHATTPLTPDERAALSAFLAE